MTIGTQDRLTELFQKYVDRNISEEEHAELFMYIRNPELKEVFLKLMDDHSRELNATASVHEVDWVGMFEEITQSKSTSSKTLFVKQIATLAASIIILVSLGLYFVNNRDTISKKQPLLFKNDIVAVQNKALLTLADGRVVSVTDSISDILELGSGVNVKRNVDGSITYHVAETSNVSSDKFHMFSTPFGGTFSLVLSDGTKVWLNASSSISFPGKFKKDERRVKITGEAYFEVAKDTKRPFYVNARNSEIRVIGTHFNVMDYKDDRRSELTLLEGSVSFRKGTYSKILAPGKQLRFAESTLEVTEVAANTTEVLSWKNNLFIFNETSVYEVLKSLSRWYNVKIRYDGDVPDVSFTGELPRASNVSKILAALELTGDLDLGIDGDVITCKKKQAE